MGMSDTRLLGAALLLPALLISSSAGAVPSSVEARRGSPENTLAACTDHLDNDLDGHEDCEDQDCFPFSICERAKSAPQAVVAPRPPVVTSRGRVRLVAGSLMLGFGFLALVASVGPWYVQAPLRGSDEKGTKIGLIAGGAVLDVLGLGLSAAGATFVALGAGEVHSVKQTKVEPLVGFTF